jgi:hypothetical protein
VIRTIFDWSDGEARQARKALDGPAPQHTASAAAAAAVTGAQEEAGLGPGIREGVPAGSELRSGAYATPAEYPQPIRVSPEAFRRGPVTQGRAALSPGHEPPRSFPPSAPGAAGGDCP